LDTACSSGGRLRRYFIKSCCLLPTVLRLCDDRGLCFPNADGELCSSFQPAGRGLGLRACICFPGRWAVHGDETSSLDALCRWPLLCALRCHCCTRHWTACVAAAVCVAECDNDMRDVSMPGSLGLPSEQAPGGRDAANRNASWSSVPWIRYRVHAVNLWRGG